MDASRDERLQMAIAAARERAQRLGEPCPSDMMVRVIAEALEPIGIVSAVGHVAAGMITEIHADALARAITAFDKAHESFAALDVISATSEEIMSDSGLLGATQVGIRCGMWATLQAIAKAANAPAASAVKEGE